ncbi:MATE family efflux transporter [Porphyromonas sp.]|uniref:MATE family efflux transporter n=1 Tax=Porphyromonas sp. TaxID=1924944 RepID=UPI0026DD4053|nr:MATE family efflux transporter [Porphyromonas sp.]MDO4695562.1 MATE family efflux transporter [Porphyromonas sp.]MDO4770518.1 MATE family efflux transporter [Porphyromonas sp.]
MSQKAAREVRILTEGSIPLHLFKLALPILGTSFVQMLYSFTDMAWLGRLNSEAIAAVGAASVFLWLAISISLINKVGSEVTVAHSVGKRDEKSGLHFANHNIHLSLIIGSILAGIFLVFGSYLLKFYELEPSIHSEGLVYLRIASIGLPFTFCSAALTGIYNATGHSKIPFIISSVGLFLNMGLDPLFIFTFGMGSKGAGVATVLAQIIVCALFIFQIKYKDRLLGGVSFFAKLSWGTCYKIFKIGIPVALFNSLFAFINMYLGRLASLAGGHIGVLTLTTGGQLEAISWNTAQGFSTALSAFISQNYGAKKLSRVIDAFKFTLRMTFIFGLGSTALYVFGGEGLFSLIVPDPIAYEAGGIYLRISGYSQLFMMLEITTQGFFYGIRKTIPPAAISIGGNLLRIPICLVALQYFPSVETIWIVIAATTTLKGFLAMLWYLRERQRLLKEG